MEAELWKQVYKLVIKMAMGKTIKRATYTDGDIILTYMWAVIHDRPVYWACKKKNWPIYYRRRPLPNPSTMTRRLRRPQLQKLLAEMEKSLVDRSPRSVCRWIDGKPLAIGGASKDSESAFGFGASCICKGYKLYAVSDLNQGFKRMRFRGIEKAKIQNLMIAAIQNLRKLMRYAGNKPAAEVRNPALSRLLLAVFAFYRRCLVLRQIPSYIERILIFQRAIGNNSPTQHIIKNSIAKTDWATRPQAPG